MHYPNYVGSMGGRPPRRIGRWVLMLAALVLLAAPASPETLAQTEAGPLVLQWSSSTILNTSMVAWGDYDGDGDLDLAAANGRLHTSLYRNTNGSLESTTIWTAPDDGSTISVAWGDVDRDGDLDLIAGNDGQPNRLYRNDGVNAGGEPIFTAVWASKEASHTQSVAWGDYDGDSDFDLAVGNNGEPNRLYRNDGVGADGRPLFVLAWSAPLSENTKSVAWGDIDGDGRLDLVVGNNGQPTRLYLNRGLDSNNQPIFDLAWSAPQDRATSSIALGDVDNDGDLDLALGNANQSNQIYRNCTNRTANSECTPDERTFSSTPYWEASEHGLTWSIALGDYDGDGNLDLVVGSAGISGSSGQPILLYRNTPGGFSITATWQSLEVGHTSSVAWGDVDNDGDLDLAVANFDDPNRVYANTKSVLAQAPGWRSSEINRTTSFAWGDVDNDGDLDLVAGNGDVYSQDSRRAQPNRLYRNFNGTLKLDSSWTPPAENTRSVAWGDVDGDGDLDLAVGNSGMSNRLYRNEHGVLTLDTRWSPLSRDTWSVAWGDVDNDGDLDLAVGNGGANDNETQSNELYRNDNGMLSSAPDPEWNPPAEATRSLMWGDVDNDGDLDLAVGNFGLPARLYLNRAGHLDSTPAVTLQGSVLANGVAWGDVDGDGDLDLAIANLNRSSRLYRNTNGTLDPLPAWASEESSGSTSVAWGDVDNDGDLDLAIGDSAHTARVYLNNNGMLDTRTTWTPTLANSTRGIAWGDVDNDGDLDLAVANHGLNGSAGETDHLYLNTRNVQSGQAPSPVIHIDHSDPPASANLYSTAHVWSSETATFTYTLSHPGSLPVRQVVGMYSLNGGGQWFPAVAAPGTHNTNLSTSPAGTVYTYTWDIYQSGVMGQSDNVVFRLLATPSVTPTRNLTPVPYLHGGYAATTFPFRVRGTQVRVLKDGQPVAGAMVYRQPAGQTYGAEPLSGGGPPFRTDGEGYLQGRGVLEPGDQIAAVLPISATDTYTLYLTSAAPITTGLAMQTVQPTGVQTLTVSSANPLILFNLDVSLEWDARADTRYLTQLDFDLKRASELLYDWTNGQAALGRVRVFHDKQDWNDAHIRVYATNRLRPNANQGGIVTRVITDPVSLQATEPITSAIVYEPGQVHMGSVWNRYGEASGNLGQDWPRALAHELGHFALFLDDNYLGLDQEKLLIPVDGCPGAMTDPYRDDYSEFHPDAGWERDCQNTLSQQTTGRSDWATIKTFYDRGELDFRLNHPSTFDENPGPTGIPIDVTRLQFVEPVTPTRALEEPVFYMMQNGARLQPSAGARAFLFHGDRIVDLGSPTLDYVRAPGATPGDRLCIYDLAALKEGGQPTPRLGCETISAGDEQLELASRPGWQPQVLVTPVTSRTIELSVTATISATGGAAEPPLWAALYPGYVASGSPISYTIPLTPTGAGVYSGAFQLGAGEPGFDGYVHVWVDEAEPRREVVTDYALGGSPGNARSRDTPRGNPGNARSRDTPVMSADGQAILFGKQLYFPPGTFYSIQTATKLPETPQWATVVGQGYYLVRSAGAPDLGGTSLSFSYLGRDVPPGEEQWLTVYYRGERADTCQPQPVPCWLPLPTARDATHNIVSAATKGPGFYAVMSSIEIPLLNGPNVAAYPVRTSRTVQDALASITGAYTLVEGYDRQHDRWQALGPSDMLEFGKGYRITVDRDITWRLKGDDPNAPLAAADAVAAPALFTGSLPSAPGFSPRPGVPVVARVEGHVCGQGGTLADGGRVAYAVYVASEAAGLPGCGAPNRTVVFEVGTRRVMTASWKERS